jgi:hypothetical protein
MRGSVNCVGVNLRLKTLWNNTRIPHPQPLSRSGRGEQESGSPSPLLGEGARG